MSGDVARRSVAHGEHDEGRRAARHRGRERRERSSTIPPAARRARRTTAPTSGSSATRRISSPACGWASTSRRRSRRNAQGGMLAAPAWTAFMNEVYRRKPAPRDWPMPEGIVTREIDPSTNMLATPGCPPRRVATEFFIAGTDPIAPARAHGVRALAGYVGRRQPQRTPRARPSSTARSADAAGRHHASPSRHVRSRPRCHRATSLARLRIRMRVASSTAFHRDTGRAVPRRHLIRSRRRHDLAAGRLPRALHVLRRRAHGRRGGRAREALGVRVACPTTSRATCARASRPVEAHRELPRRPRPATTCCAAASSAGTITSGAKCRPWLVRRFTHRVGSLHAVRMPDGSFVHAFSSRAAGRADRPRRTWTRTSRRSSRWRARCRSTSSRIPRS